MKGQKIKELYFGGDYNPDQWDEATIRQDMEYFKKCHINYVALPVFSWAKLEPQEGVYNFEWLDKILDILWENRIYVCLATSTAAQPEWMSKKYPEIMPVDNNGLKRTHGMRNFYCVNSENTEKEQQLWQSRWHFVTKIIRGLLHGMWQMNTAHSVTVRTAKRSSVYG